MLRIVSMLSVQVGTLGQSITPLLFSYMVIAALSCHEAVVTVDHHGNSNVHLAGGWPGVTVFMNIFSFFGIACTICPLAWVPCRITREFCCRWHILAWRCPPECQPSLCLSVFWKVPPGFWFLVSLTVGICPPRFGFR